MGLQKPLSRACYWSGYMHWAFLRGPSVLGGPWEATGILDRGWGFELLGLNPVMPLIGCASLRQVTLPL